MFTPLNVNTHYSLMRGYAKPDKLLKSCADYGYGACAINDYELLSGAVNFYKAAKENSIKPIIGTKIKVINGTNSGYLSFLALNKEGWKTLMSLSTRSYLNPEPCLQLFDVLYKKDLLCISGDYDSLMDEKSIKGLKESYGDNFYMGNNHEKSKDCAEWENIKLIDYTPVLYVSEKDKAHQLLLYSSDLDIKASEWHIEQDPSFQRYHKNTFALNPPDKKQHPFIQEIVDKCENYSILGKPNLPKFPCPNGMSESDYLLELCREGWKKKYLSKKMDKATQDIYVARIQKELAVIQKAQLEGYFLIVQEYVNWAKNQGWLVGPGRGSAAGCLLSQLLNITNVDPIEHGLLFERFYNDGRNTAEKVALPDVDMDFQPSKREYIIAHIKDVVGHDKVCQVATFGSLQGRGALKEVLRVFDVCDDKRMNEITKKLPQKDKISDKLEEEQEVSIIRWTLRNEPKNLEDLVIMNDDETLSGPMASYFETAIEIESTFKSYGKHACALALSGLKMIDACPMIKEKNGNELIAGIEYTEMEEMGITKLDILGLATLDKLMGAKNLLKGIK